MRDFDHRHTLALVHQDWTVWWDMLQLAVLFIFLSIQLWPAKALAFTNDVELSHLTLIFVRDPTLSDRAVVGIEAFPRERTVAGILAAPYLAVNASVTEGSVVRVLATAYSSTSHETDASPFITASGSRVGSGTMAANFLPFGTKVRIGQNMYTISDRLNSRYDELFVVDVWQPNRRAALLFGARIVEMEIVALP